MFEYEPLKLYDPDKDGIDHINTYSQGKTELGRLMSNFAYTPFTFEPYGTFYSGESFYFYYLTGCKHEVLKTLVGNKAKVEAEKYRNDRIDVMGLSDEMLSVITNMMIIKTAATPRLLELLTESTLPFCHYYYKYGRVYQFEGHDWFSEAWENIRKAIKDF